MKKNKNVKIERKEKNEKQCGRNIRLGERRKKERKKVYEGEEERKIAERKYWKGEKKEDRKSKDKK